MSKALKLALESIISAALIFGVPNLASTQTKTDYIIQVANHSRDKKEVEKFNQGLKSKGYMPQTDITHLVDGATLYYSIFEIKSDSDKKSIDKSLTEKTNAYCESIEKSIFYDEKEIRKTIRNFTRAILSENIDRAYSFFSESAYTTSGDEKNKITREMLKESFEKQDYKKFRLDDIIKDNSDIIYSYEEIKKKFADKKDAIKELGMKNKDYLVELNFNKEFLENKWFFLFRKIKDNWKIIAFN